MTAKIRSSSARNAAAQLDIDRAIVAERLGGPSPGLPTPRAQYMAGVPLISVTPAVGAPQMPPGKRAKPG